MLLSCVVAILFAYSTLFSSLILLSQSLSAAVVSQRDKLDAAKAVLGKYGEYFSQAYFELHRQKFGLHKVRLWCLLLDLGFVALQK